MEKNPTIAAYQQEIEAAGIANEEQLEVFRIRFLGSKGLLKSLFTAMKDIPPEERKIYGQQINALKTAAEEKYESAKNKLGQPKKDSLEMDPTLPGTAYPPGSRHPLSLIRNRIIRIFGTLGFVVAEGPEIEDDWHNFSALNMPADHPARDMQDTFYISKDPDWVLRTHTSSVQVRVMEQGRFPIRIICPGRVFRNETVSARANSFFHQVEGLFIDEQVSFADLKQTLYYFVHAMFGSQIELRFRPSYFPFTEPSAEMDITCLICNGNGCAVCKHTGWVEILGCGMVHPRLLENCKVDSNRYSGYAFGMGIERITMLKYQISDLRLFAENDIRFLKQFAGES
jgi:phenylalanyl-tRNA synthetase alpha chain